MNPYKKYLDKLFSRIIELRHTASHINTYLQNSIKDIEKFPHSFLSNSALVISDWTGPTDSGWEINFHTGIRKTTYKENYKSEVENIISQECCYAFAQSFEALERFLKDYIFYRIQKDPNFTIELRSSTSERILRDDIPGGDRLYKILKKSADPSFSEFSKSNNYNLRFKEFWSVISQTRHAVVHSNSEIAVFKIKKSKYHLKVFNHFFKSKEIDDQKVLIRLDYKMLDKLLKTIAEFAYQIYKSISINERLEWEINKK